MSHFEINHEHRQYAIPFPSMRMEPLPHGESQLQPNGNPNAYHPHEVAPNDNEECILEPVVAMLAMSVKMEKALLQEKRVSKGMYMVTNNLQMRINQMEAGFVAKDSRIRNLESENHRLSRELANSRLQEICTQEVSKPANAMDSKLMLQPDKTPTTLSDYRSVDFSPSLMLPPPIQPTSPRNIAPVPQEPIHTSSADTAVVHPSNKRTSDSQPTQNSTKRPRVGVSFRSPKTPSPMDPFRMTW